MTQPATCNLQPANYKLNLIVGLLFICLQATAGTVVVTPGSLAGYTYFPPEQQNGSGSGGEGDNVSTLLRCYWSPNAGQQTVKIVDQYSYGKPFTFTYKMAGGDGGSTLASGGGGSSAILVNGKLINIAKGGDGGFNASAEIKTGIFSAVNGDQIEFIVGGGGGFGVQLSQGAIGGGGGAGYMGGGGGGTLFNRNLTSAEVASIGGKGGGSMPGAGGYISGGYAGTDGNGSNGGISTSPDGSSAPKGSPAGGFYSNMVTYYKNVPIASTLTTRYPATPTQMGSPTNGDNANLNYFSGGGGKLGTGGNSTFSLSTADYYGEHTDTSIMSEISNNYRYYWNGSYAQIMLTTIAFTTISWGYPANDSSMNLTRTMRTAPPQTGVPLPIVNGSLPGQIILMYQAPVCGILN